MKLTGYRKLIMTAIIGAVVALIPEISGHDMTPGQVDLLKNLIMAAFGGNAIEHLSGVLKDYAANRVRNSDPVVGAVHSVRSVTDPEQAPTGADRH